MFSLFNFGAKSKKPRSKKVLTKVPKKLLSICKKLKVKLSKKKAGKVVRKSVKTLKKECLKKIATLKKLSLKSKVSRTKKPVRKTTTVKRMRVVPMTKGVKGGVGFEGRVYKFGQQFAPFKIDPEYGYKNLPTPQKTSFNGINAEFFGERIPTVLPPSWNVTCERNGNCIPVGYPFQSGRGANFGMFKGRDSKYGMFAGLAAKLGSKAANKLKSKLPALMDKAKEKVMAKIDAKVNSYSDK